jgi:hypothetical protein
MGIGDAKTSSNAIVSMRVDQSACPLRLDLAALSRLAE